MGIWEYIFGMALMSKYLPDKATKSKIVTGFAEIATEEGLKLVPGGVSAYKVYTKSVRDVKKSQGHEVPDVKGLNAKVERLEKQVIERIESLEKQVCQCRKFHEPVEEKQSETHKPFVNSKL